MGRDREPDRWHVVLRTWTAAPSMGTCPRSTRAPGLSAGGSSAPEVHRWVQGEGPRHGRDCYPPPARRPSRGMIRHNQPVCPTVPTPVLPGRTRVSADPATTDNRRHGCSLVALMQQPYIWVACSCGLSPLSSQASRLSDPSEDVETRYVDPSKSSIEGCRNAVGWLRARRPLPASAG